MISLKLENKKPEGGEQVGFQIFLMATHVFLFIHAILYAHILYVLHRNLLHVAQKTVVSTKKYFTLKLTPEAKIMPVTKRYVVATKNM